MIGKETQIENTNSLPDEDRYCAFYLAKMRAVMDPTMLPGSRAFFERKIREYEDDHDMLVTVVTSFWRKFPLYFEELSEQDVAKIKPPKVGRVERKILKDERDKLEEERDINEILAGRLQDRALIK